MKIRILTQNPFSVWFGGVEQQAVKYREYIQKLDKNIDIDFLKWNEENFDILHIIGIHTGINPYWIDVLKKKWVKIVVSSVFYLSPNYFLDFRRPIVYKIFSHIPHHIVHWMKELLLRADLILPNSLAEKKQLEYIFGISSDKMDILYNGVDSCFFENIREDDFCQKYNISDYFLCVGHIEPRKNHLFLIEEFLDWKKNTKNCTKLVLLGDYRGNYFKYHKEVQSLIDENDDVLHIAHLKNSDQSFRSAYLWAKAHFLLSSLETPWLSNIEAGIAGIPLVIGDCDPVREYFKDFAYYVSWLQKNFRSIFSEVQKKWKNQDQIDFILRYYSWEVISQKLLDFYAWLWSQK